ncbi:MAG: hypothetical protein NVSMB39_1930 [Candidatus Saccharimonadales bacterium]
MDNETLTPGASNPFSTPPTRPSRGRGPLGPILLVLLALGTIIFGALTIYFAGVASTATKTLNAQKAVAAKVAADSQKLADDAEHVKANESPYRAYVAPPEFGSFIINFPKNWSSYVDHEPTGRQVALALNPDFVHRTNGSDDIMATRVTLQERTKDQYISQYAALVKNKTMKQAPITVSGLPAFDFTGKFPDRKTIHEVVVPIRDKVLTFSTENVTYSAEFNQIVASSKIIP